MPAWWAVALAVATAVVPLRTALADDEGWQTLQVPGSGERATASERYRVIRPGPDSGRAEVREVWLRFTARRLDGGLVLQAPAVPDAPVAADMPAAANAAGAAGRAAQRFSLDQLAPGLQAAVKQMPVGARWEVEVPYALGPLRAHAHLLRGHSLLFDIERMAPPDAPG